jgi:hypothetical protein
LFDSRIFGREPIQEIGQGSGGFLGGQSEVVQQHSEQHAVDEELGLRQVERDGLGRGRGRGRRRGRRRKS